jgi:hypothetical protein
MLMTARDIITRLRTPMRSEFAWSCRAIFAAAPAMSVSSRQSERARHGEASGQLQPSTHRPIGPAGSHPPATPKDFSRSPRPVEAAPAQPTASPAANFDAIEWSSVQQNGVELRQSFAVPFARPRSGVSSPISIR